MGDSLLRVLAGFALLCTAAGLAYTGLAIVQMRRFRDRTLRRRARFTVPVTVLKPLHGDEPFLHANLASFCEQDYRGYQVIFGAADPNDPALEVARRVA